MKHIAPLLLCLIAATATLLAWLVGAGVAMGAFLAGAPAPVCEAEPRSARTARSRRKRVRVFAGSDRYVARVPKLVRPCAQGARSGRMAPWRALHATPLPEAIARARNARCPLHTPRR